MTADASPEPAGSGRLAAVLGLLRADAPATIRGAPQGWPRWAVLLPHVLAATSHFGSLPPQGQGPAGADASWLLGRAATYLQVHARLSEARPLAERALAIAEAVYGPDHPDVGAALSNLALILKDLGQQSRARPLAERALAITEAAYGPDHPLAKTLRTNLAGIVADLGPIGDIESAADVGEVPGIQEQRPRPEGSVDDST
jgi:hypothetical protein